MRAVFDEILTLSNIEILGLMSIAPLEATKEELRGLFREIREFRDELEIKYHISLPEL